MARTRPYLVRLQGKARMVVATSREQAIGHCTKPLVDECRPAKPKEVMDFARGGGDMETAGVYPEPEGVIPLRSSGDAIPVSDARTWLIENLPKNVVEPTALEAFDRAREAGELDFDTFEEISEQHPAFVDALVGDGELMEFREGLGASAMPFDDVVAKILAAAEKAPDAAIAHDGHNVEGDDKK